MEKFLLTLIAASGLCVVSSHFAKQFYFIPEPKTWTEAQRYCRQRYTDLATIEGLEDEQTLRDRAGVPPTTLAWIGLYDDLASQRWSMPDGEVEFTNWAPTQPDDDGARLPCGGMTTDGLWADYSCGDFRRAVCSNVQGSNVTYVLTDVMYWIVAQNFCREKYTDLVSVRSSEENQKVRDLIPPGEEAVWIGISRETWKWSDGTRSSFRDWIYNRPWGKPCVVADFRYSPSWADYECATEFPFICQGSSPVETRKQMLRLEVETDAPLDENDPAVLEELLNQLRQKLEEQGLSAQDLKLTWVEQADGKVFQKAEKDEL